ncbi:MAG TPA: retroviral-like aspartic protease family protein, partial [Rhodocyclaceae bacterium]|nr:retroviral-like aspartic protease family protein [Rhodocyclaceae bacterium]
MDFVFCGKRIVLACILCAVPITVLATDVALMGLFPGKAVLVIDGGAPKTMSVGQVQGNVKLVDVDREGATVEIDGKKNRLALGGQPIMAFESHGDEANGQTVNLTADARGHFSTVGTINGATVNFFVDTGASDVAMGPSTARLAGIDYRNGESGYAS